MYAIRSYYELRNFLKSEIKDQKERKEVLEKVFSDKKFKLELLELIEKHRRNNFV